MYVVQDCTLRQCRLICCQCAWSIQCVRHESYCLEVAVSFQASFKVCKTTSRLRQKEHTALCTTYHCKSEVHNEANIIALNNLTTQLQTLQMSSDTCSGDDEKLVHSI